MICINIVTLHSSPQRTWDDKARFERQKPDRFRRASPTAWGREGKHSRRVRAGADRLSEAVEGLQQTRSSVWKSPGMDFKFESNLIVCGRRPRITWVVVLGFFVSKILAASLSLWTFLLFFYIFLCFYYYLFIFIRIVYALFYTLLKYLMVWVHQLRFFCPNKTPGMSGYLNIFLT